MRTGMGLHIHPQPTEGGARTIVKCCEINDS